VAYFSRHCRVLPQTLTSKVDKSTQTSITANFILQNT